MLCELSLKASAFELLDIECPFSRPDSTTTIYPADVVLFEGILVFYFPAIRELFHMKLFVDTDSDTRLARRGELTSISQLLRAELIRFNCSAAGHQREGS